MKQVLNELLENSDKSGKSLRTPTKKNERKKTKYGK